MFDSVFDQALQSVDDVLLEQFGNVKVDIDGEPKWGIYDDPSASNQISFGGQIVSDNPTLSMLEKDVGHLKRRDALTLTFKSRLQRTFTVKKALPGGDGWVRIELKEASSESTSTVITY